MLTRLFNQALPSPTEEQLQTMLNSKEIGLFSEIISAAYEPRFKLYALGSATGDLYVINDNNYLYSYIPTSPEPPILKIIPLTNSSTFLSVSSYSLFCNHCFQIPRENRSSQLNDIFFKNNSILSEIKPDKSRSFITHWIITHDGVILHRTITLKYDIIDFAASPIHPEFVLLLTKTGSIYGFSVEEMKFTDLYFNDFEGKNVHSIICPFDMKFFICHDIIEKLDMIDKDLSKGAQINVSQVDIYNEKSNMIAGIEYQQKKPTLFKGNRSSVSVDLPEGSFGTCVSMINDKDWTSIVHSNNGDSIYFGNQMKVCLDNEMLVPSITVEYQKPISREVPQSIKFFTSSGRSLDLHGNTKDYFMLKPIDPKYAYIDKNGNIYVFNLKKQCYIFEKNSYAGNFLFDLAKPLAVLNGYALCKNENNELFIADIKTNKEVKLESPLLPSPIVSEQIYENYIDFLCENDKVIRFDLSSKEKFEGEELSDDQELSIYSNYPKNDKDIKFWRPFSDTFAFIKYVNSRPVLTVDNLTSNEVCEKNEKLIYFDVIDESGKVTPKSAMLILTVTTYYVSIFACDKKVLKRIRHVSISRDPIVEASVTSWGVLIVRTRESVQMLVLPDVSYKPIAQLGLDYYAPPPLPEAYDEDNSNTESNNNSNDKEANNNNNSNNNNSSNNNSNDKEANNNNNSNDKEANNNNNSNDKEANNNNNSNNKEANDTNSNDKNSNDTSSNDTSSNDKNANDTSSNDKEANDKKSKSKKSKNKKSKDKKSKDKKKKDNDNDDDNDASDDDDTKNDNEISNANDNDDNRKDSCSVSSAAVSEDSSNLSLDKTQTGDKSNSETAIPKKKWLNFSLFKKKSKKTNQPVSEGETQTIPTDDVDSADQTAPPPSSDDDINNVKSINPIVLPHKGLIIFERNLVTLFLPSVTRAPCFDESDPPPVLVPPPATGLKKIFGKKGGMSIEEADRCFLFKRSEKRTDAMQAPSSSSSSSSARNNEGQNAEARAASIGNSLAETQELMQQLLVKANERGEQLNELEIKAQKLLDSAKQFKKKARQFKH